MSTLFQRPISVPEIDMVDLVDLEDSAPALRSDMQGPQVSDPNGYRPDVIVVDDDDPAVDVSFYGDCDNDPEETVAGEVGGASRFVDSDQDKYFAALFPVASPRPSSAGAPGPGSADDSPQFIALHDITSSQEGENSASPFSLDTIPSPRHEVFAENRLLPVPPEAETIVLDDPLGEEEVQILNEHDDFREFGSLAEYAPGELQSMSEIDFNKLFPPALPPPAARKSSQKRPISETRKTQTNRQEKLPRPKAAVEVHEFESSQVKYKGRTIRPTAPGKTTAVELQDGTFLRIQSIIERYIYGNGAGADEPLHQIILKGLRFKRARLCSGYLPLKKNEVVLYSDDTEVYLDDIKRSRVLVMTSSPLPLDNPCLMYPGPLPNDDEDTGRLVCRWKMNLPFSFASSSAVRFHTPSEGYVRRLVSEECDPQYRIEDSVSKAQWRGGHANTTEKKACSTAQEMAANPRVTDEELYNYFNEQGESMEGQENGCAISKIKHESAVTDRNEARYSTQSFPSSIDLTSSCPPDEQPGTPSALYEEADAHLPDFDNLHIRTSPRSPSSHAVECEFSADSGSAYSSANGTTSRSTAAREYTFGDSFCGGGGMSCGARAAGFINKWAFDFDKYAVQTYRSNFRSCVTWHYSVDRFLNIVNGSDTARVDVLHLSPPCQPHSPAHTIAGKDDEMNEASMLCITDLLRAARPRIATVEETFGILNRPEWFRALVNAFTFIGFSVKWKVLRCVEYGVPQERKRLFILASCPGEALPNFPQPKYALPNDNNTYQRKPPRTVRDAISYIPPDADNHNPITFPNGEFRTPPVGWDDPFSRTLLAGGGEYDVHPSGTRPFTVRELACLQTFPMNHVFHGSITHARKQIGNAVPPIMAEELMLEVRTTLEASDEGQLRERADSPITIHSLDSDDEKDVDDGNAGNFSEHCNGSNTDGDPDVAMGEECMELDNDNIVETISLV